MGFGQRLKHLREVQGWTRDDLALRLQTSYSTIAKYESGSRSPDQTITTKIADLFNVSLDYLLCRTDDPTPSFSKDKPTPQEQLAEMGVEVWARGHALTQEDVDFIKAYLETKEQQRKGGMRRK